MSLTASWTNGGGGTACTVCGSAMVLTGIERPNVPVAQNHLCGTRAEAAAVPRGSMRLGHCPACDFVANLSFDPRLTRYGERYENSQICSPVFDAYVESRVTDLIERGVRGRHIIEIGCGSGYFLRRLCERGDNTGIGYDESYRGPSAPAPGVAFVRGFYDETTSERGDVAICRHVIEHVREPVPLLRSLRAAAGGSTQGLVVVETPALDWILENTAVQDLFYEHCSYFTGASMAVALQVAQLMPIRQIRTFGEQYLWAEAAPTASDASANRSDSDLTRLLRQFKTREADYMQFARQRVAELAESGGVAIWGAGAKGVTFLNLIDPEAVRIPFVVDINPAKQGGFIPGTGHGIVPAERLAGGEVAHVLLMNANYRDECAQLVRELAVPVTLHATELGA